MINQSVEQPHPPTVPPDDLGQRLARLSITAELVPHAHRAQVVLTVDRLEALVGDLLGTNYDTRDHLDPDDCC